MMRRPAPVLLALLLAPLLVAVPMLSAAGSPAYADAAATARPGTVREPLVRSTYALVVDQDTDEVLYEKNPVKVSSIASITKLMTAIVVLEAKLPLDEELVLGNEDRTSAGWWGSAMHPGVRMTRGEALHLALMSSENHAAHLLARTYPGGVEAAVEAMNARAALIGMADAHFADPTGLSPENRATAVDLVLLVKAAYAYPEIREFSTSHEYRLLSYLMHHAGRIISRSEIVEHLYEQDFDRDSNTIEVFIGRLRKKLGVDIIRTARGLGYAVGADEETPAGR